MQYIGIFLLQIYIIYISFIVKYCSIYYLSSAFCAIMVTCVYIEWLITDHYFVHVVMFLYIVLTGSWVFYWKLLSALMTISVIYCICHFCVVLYCVSNPSLSRDTFNRSLLWACRDVLIHPYDRFLSVELKTTVGAFDIFWYLLHMSFWRFFVLWWLP